MRITPLIVAIALCGCVDTSQSPSLLPQPVESLSFDEPVRPAPVATPDAALDAQIAAATAKLDALAAAFNKGAQEAEAKVAVARGMGAGSSRWLDAQTALANLDTLRAPVLNELADLEQAATERGVAGLPSYPALDAAIARADALTQAQQDRSGALEAALAGA